MTANAGAAPDKAVWDTVVPITAVPMPGQAAEAPNLLLQGCNDSANAARLIALHGQNLKFCYPMKKWLVWDGRHWTIDEAGCAERLAKLTIVEFLRQATARQSTEHQKFALASLDAKRINGMLAMAKCEVPVAPDELDTSTFLLNFHNGTLDLTNGLLGPHRREHLITKIINHNYDPAASCPLFGKFILRIMGAKPAGSAAERRRAARLAASLRRALGYSLTASTREKVVFFAWGGGNNGKTTLLATIFRILGTYAALIQVDSLMAKQFGESNNSMADLADLRGARFVMTSETEEGQRLAEGKIKRITQGMGKIKATRKYENPIEFLETHKLWIDANHKPVIRGSDDAVWNRLYLIPFGETIPKSEIDPDLHLKLLAEAEGILAWVVRGCLKWQRVGLGRPPEVDDARKQWREESDPLKPFIEDECVVEDGLFCGPAAIFERYLLWAGRQKLRDPLTRPQFNERMRARFKETSHRFDSSKPYGERAWAGIGLRLGL